MNDDLDENIIDSEDGFDEFSQKPGLGDIIRQSPLAKVGIVVVAAGVIGVTMMFFGGDALKEQPSSMPEGAKVTSVPGSNDEISPAYTEAVEQQNEADLERAIIEGGSSIPVPIETHSTRLAVPEVEEETEDPLHRWRMLQEERVEREMKSKKADLEPVTVLNAEKQSEAISILAESMSEQMESILGKSTEDGKFSTKTFITYNNAEGGGGGGGNAYTSNGGSGDGALRETNSFSEEEEEEVVIIPAGKIVYGQMLLEANSDIPSVVLAQMVSGPLKGWKLLGKFNLEEDIKMLTVDFNAAVNEDGKQYRIKAIMLDPDTSLAAKASDVNNRYIRRIVLPAAAKFITGYADAVAESGRTSITVSAGGTVSEAEAPKDSKQEVATGVADAAQDVGDILNELGDVPMQVMIKAGTPIGIFFTRSILESDEGRAMGGGGGI